MPDLRDFALFVAVAERGSITSGADAVGVSLATASARVAGLERHYGVALLQRGRRGVTPTPDGEALLVSARRLLDAEHDLERGMVARQRGLSHVVRLEVNSSGLDALTEVLAAVLAASPDTEVVLTESRSVHALEHVAAGSADLAVVSDASKHVGLSAKDLWDDPLVVVGGPRATSEERDRPGSMTLNEVLAQPMVGLPEGNPLQTLVEEEAFRIGTAPTYRVRLPSLSAVCAVASTGAGLAIVPAATARRLDLSAAAVTPLAESWAQRRALLVARDFEVLPAPVLTFSATLLRYRHETN